jgi:hypothetical protein
MDEDNIETAPLSISPGGHELGSFDRKEYVKRSRDDVGAAAWEVRLRRQAQADGIEMGHEPAKTP